eukprot:scaffold39144_cov70-Phaeocystis_antarctica.AAC.2
MTSAPRSRSARTLVWHPFLAATVSSRVAGQTSMAGPRWSAMRTNASGEPPSSSIHFSMTCASS